jgi:ATP-dependent DNA helicase RecG
MKADERDRIMTAFRAGEVHVLVTTTVIEVGVDVGNATVMVIEHADRFGISQLHQLRGRVGRSDLDSFCVLMSEEQITEEGEERLNAMVETEDGFALSEVDLKLRGPGELLGVRQHGVSELRLTDLLADRELAFAALNDARQYEPDEHGAYALRKQFSEGADLYSY